MTLKSFFLVISSYLMIKPCLAMIASNIKCRGGTYPRSNVQRYYVPDDKVSWSVLYENYNPPTFTSPGLKGKPYADLDFRDPNFKPKWNSVDGNVSRVSYIGNYQILNGTALNPVGRTGVKGRGILGRWGPNHAADPVVSRWKQMNGVTEINPETKRRVLQFVAVQRGDTGEWALPGGMVDPGELVSVTAVREFQEEATNSLLMTDDEKQAWKARFEKFFSSGDEIYRGYVDDPRNTDNAWMETVAYSYHDVSGSTVGSLTLSAGDDAVGVRWLDYSPSLRLYGSHGAILRAVAEKLDAHR